MRLSEAPCATLLIVDGDLDRRLALRAFLESAGHSVVFSLPGDALIEVCRRQRPALLLLDAGSDWECAHSTSQRVRELCSEPVAVLWGLAAEEPGLRERARSLGADDSLSWPVSRSELLWRVRSLLRWRSQAAAADGALVQIQLDELLQQQRQREQSLALVVHDMKNPLSGVISNVEYLRGSLQDAPPADPELPECARDILQASRRLYRMVQSLLDVSQSEDGLLPFEPQRVDVRALLEEAHSACRARLRDKHIELSIARPDEPLALAADHDMLLRLLSNLLDNAITATQSAGAVQLGAAALHDAVELWVRDEGLSFPAADRARVLPQPASELRKARLRRGLGLQACRVIAEAHGGTISVDDHQTRGATVRVRLPRPA